MSGSQQKVFVTSSYVFFCAFAILGFWWNAKKRNVVLHFCYVRFYCDVVSVVFNLKYFFYLFSLIMYQCYVCDVDDKSQNVWWSVVFVTCYCQSRYCECCYCGSWCLMPKSFRISFSYSPSNLSVRCIADSATRHVTYGAALKTEQESRMYTAPANANPGHRGLVTRSNDVVNGRSACGQR